MKTNTNPFTRLPLVAAGLLLTFAPQVYSQIETDKQALAKAEKGENDSAANGRVFSVEPELLSVVVEGSATPLQFKYDKSTPYVDENGKEVPVDLIRPDLPLTVHYTGTGEKLTASKVVVTRSMVDGASPSSEQKREAIADDHAKEARKEKMAKETGPETVMGTVSTIEQTISMHARGETSPRSFVINNSTRYLNAAGQPVSSNLIFSGQPITVKSVSDGDRMIAQVITVRGGGQASSQYPQNLNGGGASGTGTSGTSTAGNTTEGTSSEGTASNRNSRTTDGGGSVGDIPINGLNNYPGLIVPNGNGLSSPTGPVAQTTGTNPSTANGNPGTPNGTASTNGNPSGTNAAGTPNNPNGTSSNRTATNGTNAADNRPNPDNQPNPDNKPSPATPSNATPAPATGSGSSTNRSGSTGSGTRSSSNSSGSSRASGNGSSGGSAPASGGGASGGAPAPSKR